MGKVIRAFEFQIKESRYNKEEATDFRENARLRIAVWKARRANGGEMGIAMPEYFTIEGKKHYLSQAYYQNDTEAEKLRINIKEGNR